MNTRPQTSPRPQTSVELGLAKELPLIVVPVTGVAIASRGAPEYT